MSILPQQLPLFPVLKRCTKCGVEQPLDDFYRQRARPDGHREQCKTCVRAYNKLRYWIDPEHHKAKARAWQAANPERARAQSKAWRTANPERKYELAQRWYWSDPETRRRKATEYYAANRERLVEQMRQYGRAHSAEKVERARRWKLAHPERARANSTVCIHRRRARKLAAAGDATREQIEARMNYYGWRCWMCGEPATAIDHVIALARGGSNWPANLRPACRKCNSRKGARDWREFVPATRAP